MDQDRSVVRCSALVMWWTVPVLVGGVWLALPRLDADTYLARGLAWGTLLVTTYYVLWIARFVLVARDSEIGFAFFEYDDVSLRVREPRGYRELRWGDVSTVSMPKNPRDVDGWYKPFTVQNEREKYVFRTKPRGWSFESLHADVLQRIEQNRRRRET